MKLPKFYHIIAAIIVLFVITSFQPLISSDYSSLVLLLIFSAAIILVAVFSKKIMADFLDASVEHKIWGTRRYWFRPHDYLNIEIPLGIILPIFFSFFSIGYLKVMTLLTFETQALKRRVAKRHGFFSFTEMTDWHDGLIGAAGIFSILLLALIAYLLPIPALETLSKLAAYYAFFNMLPIGALDGYKILNGSRVLYTTLAIVTLIFTAYALLLV